jgi:GxxExxY protein
MSHRGTKAESKGNLKGITSPITDSLTKQTIACADKVHRRIAPGLFEMIYESAMAMELEIAGVKLQKQVIFPTPYRDRLISQRRLDSLIEDKVAVEPKRKERFDAGFEAQILTYLKLPGLKTYLLTNFNSGLRKSGIRRFIL